MHSALLYLLLPYFVSLNLAFAPAPNGSKISFQIKNAGITVEGVFKDVETEIQYNEAAPEKSVFKGKARVSSINTGISTRDKHLMGADYFHEEKYPWIQFQSTSIKVKSPNTMQVEGILTMKGVSKNISITVQRNDAKKAFETQFTLNRRDFGVGGNSWVMSDEVKVNLLVGY